MFGKSELIKEKLDYGGNSGTWGLVMGRGLPRGSGGTPAAEAARFEMPLIDPV
jgi:hypothetical protein